MPKRGWSIRSVTVQLSALPLSSVRSQVTVPGLLTAPVELTLEAVYALALKVNDVKEVVMVLVPNAFTL